ncbi:PP2C family protein-serine/threonine phosphatase [Nonomuraea sp. LPB2021202275-12-8]|uniref:PP2C family protein-serine/threonine phosphatase n=1 Tax=Nonomuraea sp. LPB2021202275-12-8 TaxID=3120159 RepID=UPI00300D8E10
MWGSRPEPGRVILSTWIFVVALVAVTVVVVWLDATLGTAVGLVPLLIFLPAIVAALGTVTQTVIASVWVLLVVAASAAYLGGAGLSENLGAIGFTAAFGVLSALGCRYRIRREEEIHRLRSAAAALQRQIVRPLPLRTGEVIVDGLYQPVEEDTMVGGDMYEVTASPYGTRVLIADVQGKGLPAIGTAFAVLGAFREAAYRESTLAGVVDALEVAVVRHNSIAQHTGEPERFVTALVLDIGPGQGVQAVNCGHIEPYLLYDSHAGQVSLGEPGVPLGLAGLSAEPRAGAWFAFPPMGTLLLCTDGVTEARAPGGSFYPLEERLRGWADVPAGRLAGTLSADLREWTGDTPPDDIAVLILHRTQPVTAPEHLGAHAYDPGP